MATLDDLDARLRALEAARPDPLAAVPPIRIGELTDVPTPGSSIASAWAQEVTNRCRHRFPTVANRDTYWPPATAGTGALCITTDTMITWQSNGSAWLLASGPTPDQRGGGANGVDAVGASTVIAATLDFGTVAYKRVMIAHAIATATAINGPVTGRMGIMLNGGYVRTAQGRNLVQNEAETVSVATSFQVAAGVAALVQLGCYRPLGTGAWRITADPAFSYLDCTAYPA